MLGLVSVSGTWNLGPLVNRLFLGSNEQGELVVTYK